MFIPSFGFSAIVRVVSLAASSNPKGIKTTCTVGRNPAGKARLPFPAVSSAAFPRTEIVKLPAVVTLMVAVYSDPSPVKSVTLAPALAVPLNVMSSFSTPVTVSLNFISISKVAITINAPPAFAGASRIVRRGSAVSNRMAYSDDAVLVILLLFFATPAGTERVISSSVLDAGVMVAVYSAPLPVRLTVALTPVPSEMSDATNSVTDSLKVIFTSNALFCGVVGTSVMATLGPVKLIVTVCVPEAVFPFPAVSFAAPAGTWTIKLPLPVGVMVAV